MNGLNKRPTRLLGIGWVLGGLLLLSGRAEGQVSVMGSVDETTVGTEEIVRYTVEIKGAPPSDVETPRPPETEGLALVQPNPMTSQSVSYVNGEVSQSLGFQWRYRPLRQGQATIGSARVLVGGKAYSTDPITVTVVDQAQRPQRRSGRRPLEDLLTDDTRDVEPRELSDRDLFIRVRPSSRSAYLNEQIVVDYDLYFREGVQLRGSRLADSWDAEGFWREDLELDPQQEVRTVVENGLRYRIVTLKRVAVFPTRAGTLRIDPLRIETEVAVPLRSSGLFSPFFSPARFQAATIASPAVSIEARVLPADPPPGFSGAVGAFEMSVEPDRTDIEIGAPIKLTVRISGTGNVATLPPPQLELPPFIDPYEPQVADAINRKRRQVSGSKTFTYVLVPTTPGEHTLPGVRIAYFDPSERRYKRLESAPLVIRVAGGPVSPAVSVTAADGLPANDIAALMSAATSGWFSTLETPLHRHVWPFAAILAPMLLLGVLFAVRRVQTRLAGDVALARSRRAHPLAKKHLKQAETLLKSGNAVLFYDEIARALQSFAGNRMNVSVIGLTLPQLDALLVARNVPEQTRHDLKTLLTECDRARYAPVPPDRSAQETARDRAAGLIAALDAALPRVKARRS